MKLMVLMLLALTGCAATPGKHFHWYPYTDSKATETGAETYLGVGRRF